MEERVVEVKRTGQEVEERGKGLKAGSGEVRKGVKEVGMEAAMVGAMAVGLVEERVVD